MLKLTTKTYQASIILLFGVLCFLFFQLKYTYHFYYEEQEGLFLMDWEYVSGYFTENGWLSRLVGDFLTQFYYYMYAGAMILTLVLLVVGDLTRRALEAVLKLFIKNKTAASWGAFAFGVIMMIVCVFCSFDNNYRLESLIRTAGFFGLILLIFVLPSKWIWLRAGYGLVACAIMTCAFGWFTEKDFKLSKPDYLFEKVLAFDNEYYFGHYGKVIEMGEKNANDLTEEMMFFYCMALEKKGMLADKLPTLKNPQLGTFYKIQEDTPRFIIRMINELYYLIGDMTYTERAAQLANTFSSHGRSARMIKRMAEANLVNGDIPAAMKYLRLLEKTIVYKQWARIHEPGSQTTDVKEEIARKHQFINTSDNIRIGDDCYTILTQLLDSNKGNAVALDYLLLSDMLAHQRDVFVRDYEKYGPSDKTLLTEIYNSAKQTNE